MTHEEYKTEYNSIFDAYHIYQEEAKKKILNLIKSAGKELADYFLLNNFIYDKELNIYYDPKTFVAVKIEIPQLKYMTLDIDYNSIGVSIGYRCNKKFLGYNHQCLYGFKWETPEKLFLRFKKFNGKAESTRMKTYLKQYFAQDMLIGERRDKIKKLSS
jgi:hypothetical protein